MKPIGHRSRSKVGFADLYLERYGSGTVEGLPDPDPDLFLIITIPAYKEPDLTGSILSLLECDPPGVKWEIIININYPGQSGPDVIEISRASLEAVHKLSLNHNRNDVQIHCLWNPDIPVRHAGVGLARKNVMDQAVRRFNFIGNPDGIIAGFDADSTCSKNYLKSIASFYQRNPRARAANIYYEHPLSGGFDARIYHSIAQYELYLRYMRLAVEYTGHPHSIHTVGSSFTVKARTYVRVNGMGRDKAGEDFYFLHKCILLKRFWEINDTAVYPSVRESDRVSFGTGASIHRQLQNEEVLVVYRLDCFLPLRDFFSMPCFIWQLLVDGGDIESLLATLPTGLMEYLGSKNAGQRIREMFQDSAAEETFTEKFFAWFNGFQILRYLNEMHKSHYTKSPVIEEASCLAKITGIAAAESAEELLIHFRNYERGRGNRKII